jgi:hypothetical protein
VLSNCRLAGAIAVTVPGVWWGLKPSAGAGHHDEHHDDHEKHEDEEEAKEDVAEDKETKDDEAGKDEADGDKPTPQGNQDAPKTKDFKPENKKKDENSDKNLGEGVTSGGEDEQAKKQGGVANTDTRHSSDIGNNPEKSEKAPGVPDTAKVKGTVKQGGPKNK